MPYFKSLPADAGPPAVFTQYPDVYGPWSTMSEAMMNGPSPLSKGERELILAFAAGVAGCKFVCGAHAEAAYLQGIEDGLMDRLLDNLDTAPIDTRLRALLTYVRKLTLTPGAMSQVDVDTVFQAGWDEQALHSAIVITARAAFMQRLVEAHGFTPLTKEVAIKHAQRRVAKGYVNLYPAFRHKK